MNDTIVVLLQTSAGNLLAIDFSLHPVVKLLPGPLWLGVVVPVSVPSIGQTDVFKNY